MNIRKRLAAICMATAAASAALIGSDSPAFASTTPHFWVKAGSNTIPPNIDITYMIGSVSYAASDLGTIRWRCYMLCTSSDPEYQITVTDNKVDDGYSPRWHANIPGGGVYTIGDANGGKSGSTTAYKWRHDLGGAPGFWLEWGVRNSKIYKTNGA